MAIFYTNEIVFKYNSPIVDMFAQTVESFLDGKTILSLISKEEDRFYASIGYKDLPTFIKDGNFWTYINNQSSYKFLSKFLENEDNWQLFLTQYNDLNLKVLDINSTSRICERLQDKNKLAQFLMHYKKDELSRSQISNSNFIKMLNSVLIGNETENVLILKNIIENEKAFFSKSSNKLMLRSFLIDNMNNPEQFKEYYHLQHKSPIKTNHRFTYNVYINQIDIMNNIILNTRYESSDYANMINFVDKLVREKLSVSTGTIHLDDENILLTIVSENEIKINLEKLFLEAYNQYANLLKDESVSLNQGLTEFLNSYILKENLTIDLEQKDINTKKIKL